MKKNAVLFSILALSFVVGLIACSSSSKYTPPVPLTQAAAYLGGNSYSSGKIWKIDSVIWVNGSSTPGTDSGFGPIKTPSLKNGRIVFYNNGYPGPSNFASGDVTSNSAIAPGGDTTIFRYYAQGVYALNNTTTADSIYYQGIPPGGMLTSAVYGWKINLLDSSHLQVSYFDTTVVKNGTRIRLMKRYLFSPSTN